MKTTIQKHSVKLTILLAAISINIHYFNSVQVDEVTIYYGNHRDEDKTYELSHVIIVLYHY